MILKKLMLRLLMVFALGAILVGCRDTKTTDEKIEDGIEEVNEEIEEAVEEIDEEVKEQTEEVNEEIEEAAEEIEQ